MGRLSRPFTVAGEKAFQFANAGVFTERTVVAESQAVVISKDMPLEAACLIGCAVVTGAGAVLNRAKVQPGETVAVIGAGGIGQSVIQAARLSAAGRIVVIDANPGKEAVARQFGATDFLDGSTLTGDGELVQAVKDLGLPNGVDHAFECVGHPALIRHAIDLLDWGGQCILLGVPKLGTEASFVVNTLYNDKSIMGCRYGSTRPHHDIPMFVQFYLDGRMPLGEMVSQVYDLADVNARPRRPARRQAQPRGACVSVELRAAASVCVEAPPWRCSERTRAKPGPRVGRPISRRPSCRGSRRGCGSAGSPGRPGRPPGRRRGARRARRGRWPCRSRG